MKNLREYVTIKNLNTAETTVVDDEGNIEGLDDAEGAPDFFLDDDGADSHSLRPDGSNDGLDDLEAGFGDFDPFAEPEGELDAEGGLEGDLNPMDELEGEEGLEGELEGDPLAQDEFGEEQEDPDFQGVIRTVTGACLVYKRKGEEGTFEELWIYNIGKNMRNEVKIRRAILAGTDIPPQDISSPDGSQKVENTTIGNVQYLHITGLPN